MGLHEFDEFFATVKTSAIFATGIPNGFRAAIAQADERLFFRFGVVDGDLNFGRGGNFAVSDEFSYGVGDFAVIHTSK